MPSPSLPPNPLVAALDGLWPVQHWAELHTETHVLTLSALALRAVLGGQAVQVSARDRETVGHPHATLVDTCPAPLSPPITAQLWGHQVQFLSVTPVPEVPTSLGAVPYSLVHALLRDMDGLQEQACHHRLKEWTIRLNGHRVPAEDLLAHLRTAQCPEAVAEVLVEVTGRVPFVRVVFLGPELLLIGGVPGYLVAVTAAEHTALLDPIRQLRVAFGVC